MHCTHKMQFSSVDLNLQNPVVLFHLQNSNNPSCRDEHCFSAWVPLTPGPQWKPAAFSWLSLDCKVLLNLIFSIFSANISNSLRTFVWTKLPITVSAGVLCNAGSGVPWSQWHPLKDFFHWGTVTWFTNHSAGVSVLLGLVIDCAWFAHLRWAHFWCPWGVRGEWPWQWAWEILAC